MKKLLYYAAALAMAFFAGSCQQENLEPVQESTAVTFTVEAPAAIQTKAIADGLNVDELVYEVWLTPTIGTLDGAQKLYRSTTPMKVEGGVNKATLSLDLVNDQKFTVLFWAQKSGTSVYNTDNLTSVYYNSTAADAYAANDDRLAAFYAVAYVDDCQHVTESGNPTGSEVTLTRPFAQINLGTVNTSTEVGSTTGYTIVVEQSNMIIEEVPTQFNVFSSEVSEYQTIQFKMNAVPCKDLTSADAKLPGFENPSYWYAGMNYVFASKNKNVKLTYNIKTKLNGGMESTVTNTVYNVPLRENYRTNIIGNLLTSDTDYEIVVDADFSTNSNSGTTVVISEGIVQNQNGDYEITNVKGFAYMVNNLWVENGAANAATFYVHPGDYDLEGIDINSVNVQSGTLKVYNQVPVVTRSASEGAVVIKGLKKPLINVVSTGATVLFSGIIINEFEGTAAAALVNDNQGKVILSGCQIRDKNADTKLVGGNAPETVGGEEGGEEVTPELVYTAEQLKAAFENVNVSAIGLGADIAVDAPVVLPESREVTLDLRGWELTIADPTKVSETYVINNHGKLTIKDSYGIGEVNARGIYNGYVKEGDPISSATLIIEGGTFNAMGTNGGAAVYNYGILNIIGGKFTSIGSYSVNTQAGGKIIVDGGEILGGMYNSGCEVIINNGNIEGYRSGCHTVYNLNATVIINGGTLHNYNSGNSTIMAAGTTNIKYNGGTYSIKDGRVEGNGNTWTSCLLDSKDSAVSEIQGGTFNGGFRVQAGSTMTVIGGSFNDCFGSNYNIYGSVEVKGGSYKDDAAKAFATKYAHEDYKLVGEDVVKKEYVAQVGEVKYESVQDAVDAAENGATLIFLADVKQTDGVLITDKNITVDLNDKTFTVTEGASTVNRNFMINGSSVVTINNGTLIAEGELTSGAYGTVRTEGYAEVFLDNVKLYSYRGYGLNVKACNGTNIIINNSEIYSQYSGGVEAAGGTIELTNVKIKQQGVYSNAAWCSVAIGVNGGGKVTVNSGEYSAAAISTDNNAAQGTWVAYVMSSGGILDIKDGTFNGVIAETADAANACGIICADAKAEVNIYGGEFKSNGAILDMRNNTGATPNPVATLYGGTFSADPRVSGLYSSNLIKLAENRIVKENQGKYIVEEYVPTAMVGNTEYGSIEDAIANWTNNTTLTLLTDVTLSDVVTLKSTEHHILDLGTYTMTAASGKNAIEIVPEGDGAGTAAKSCLTINADVVNPGSINAGSKACVYYKKTNGINDRIMVTINGGVFNGTISSSSNNGGQACPYFVFNGGVFNKSINLTKAMLKVTGGIFHNMFSCTGDSTAHRLISGGTFKSWTFMTADAANKFCVGTDKQTYNVGVYVNKDGYLVVGGPVITEAPADNYEKKSYTSWNSYLKYSSAAEYGLYYEK